MRTSKIQNGHQGASKWPMGGIRVGGGGMPRDSFATMGLNIIVYFMVTSRQLQCDQCRETNIGDRSYERTKLKLKNRALWVAREFHEVFPMMIFVCQVFRLCEKMAIARSHCIGSIRCIK